MLHPRLGAHAVCWLRDVDVAIAVGSAVRPTLTRTEQLLSEQRARVLELERYTNAQVCLLEELLAVEESSSTGWMVNEKSGYKCSKSACVIAL